MATLQTVIHEASPSGHHYSTIISTILSKHRHRSHHSAKAMSNPPSLSHVGTGNGSIHSYTLLTPPLSPATSEGAPYIPRHDDETSLSMKKRHKALSHNRRRRRLNRACASSSELRASRDSGILNSPRLSQSKSLPSLFDPSQPSLMSKVASAANAFGTDHRDAGKRRWTLPSKAQPTQGPAARVLVENKPASITISNRDYLSPAMITLRRASTSRPTSRKMSLTFFPPPKFERSRSGLLTAFFKTITLCDDDRQQPGSTITRAGGGRRVSAVSFVGGQPEAPRKGSAPTVFTKVSGMPPSLLQPAPTVGESLVRRCSTTFISGGSVHEVIWDENVSSSGSDATPPAAVTATATGIRRRSSAIDKLETQLFKAVAQSRRASLPPQQLEAGDTHPLRSNSFASLLSARLLRSSQDTSVLPRSKSHKDRCLADALPEEAAFFDERDESGSLQFFPPLRSRSTTFDSQHSSTAAFAKPEVFESESPNVGA